MEYLIISISLVIIVIVLKIIFDVNINELKKIGKNQRLDEVTKKYPDNIEICKEYLRSLGNEDVKIEENQDSEASLYIAISNKILIANIKDSYTRIQTIAHECLHSIQDKKILIFNFIYSNIYILYFFIINILCLFKLLPQKSAFLCILIILGMLYYAIRIYLENDAMIKARYLAKEYMEEVNISPRQEIDEILQNYDNLNKCAVKAVNYNLFCNVMICNIIFSIICYIT